MQNEVTHAVLWPPGTVNEVHDLGALESAALKSVAFDVNNPGDVVGSSDTLADKAHAFLWANGRIFDLNNTIDETLGWELNEATAVNDAGTIAGNGRRNNQPRGFILKPIFPIQAEDENVYTPWNEPVVIHLRAEPEDSANEFSVIGTPLPDDPDSVATLHGSVATLGGNRFLYTPERKEEPGAAVADTFQFVVTRDQGKLRSNPGTVRIMEASYQIVDIEPPADLEPIVGVEPQAMNNQGTVVGTVRDGNGERGFLWSLTEGMALIEDCPGGRFLALDVNEQGLVAGAAPGVGRPALVDATGCQTIDEVSQGGATGLNNVGDVVGQRVILDGGFLTQAFHFETKDRIVTPLELLGGAINVPQDINDAQWIAGSSQNEDGLTRGFLLHLDGAPIDLGTLGGELSFANDLSEVDGLGDFYVAGRARRSDEVGRPVRWFHGEGETSRPRDLVVDSDLSPDTEGTSRGVNRQGDVVGEVEESAGGDRAFLWKEFGFLLDLNRVLEESSGWDQLETAWAINDQGWITGFGRKSGDSARRAFVLMPSLKSSAGLQVNLNVDSDNDDGAAPPDGSLGEEQKEDDPRGPGKILFANNADKNGNGIPGYSDRAPGDGLYVPMRVEVIAPGRSVSELKAIALQLDYPGLAPLPSFEPYPLGRFQAYVSAKNRLATLRLWKSATALRDVFNYLEPRRPYSLEELGFDLAEMAGSGRGEVLLYLEGINSTAGLPAGVEAAVGDGQRIARDRVSVTVVEPTLGVNGSGPTTGTPDVDFEIDNLDALVKDQGEGFSFWFTGVRATQPTLFQKDDLVDLFPLRFNMPGELVGQSQLRLYWSLDAADDVSMVLHPAVARELGKPRRAYVQEDAVALKQLQRIQEGAAVDRTLFSGGLLEVSPIKGGVHELIAGVNASLGGAVPPLMTLRLIAGPPGLASPSQGQVVDSVRLTLRPIEEHITLASARSARDREYDYPSDRDLVPVEVYRTPSWGDGVSGKDPTREPHKKKFLVYLHGGLTPPHEAEESSQSFFKRTYWLGYRGHFIGFTWESDRFFPGLNSYNLNAENAVLTAPGLRQFLEETVAGDWGARAKDVDVVAHSMGNVVMMDALRIGAYDKQASQGPDRLVNNVVQMGAATWLEAYEPEGAVTYTGEVPIVYEVSDLERSSFHHWFNRNGRPMKRDGGVMTGRLYHAHNPRDKVLPVVRGLDYTYNAITPRVLYCPSFPLPCPLEEFGYHFDRDGQYRRHFPFQATWFRGPTGPLAPMPDGRYVVSVAFAPSLLYTLNNGRPRYDNRRFGYGVDDLGLMSGKRPLSFADVNYEVPEELDDSLAHGFFLSRPLPEVYRFYQEFLGQAIPLGQP
jgi:probable HAF family extracellular repeat protein